MMCFYEQKAEQPDSMQVQALALPLPAWAANQVHTMDIQALIYEDGSMNIVQNWEGSFDEVQKCYIP
jgi:hypothetical protein